MNGKLKGGVSYYTKGIEVITVNFPENEVYCKNCPFCKERRKKEIRYVCARTFEPLYDVYNSRGSDCPLKIVGKEVFE